MNNKSSIIILPASCTHAPRLLLLQAKEGGVKRFAPGNKNLGNGFISNTVFQVSSEPSKFAICCNKNNYKAEFIQKYGTYSVSVLDKNASSEII